MIASLPSADVRLLFGPLSGAVLAFGIAGLALLVPHYSHVHQTVSEIGEVGSPARVPFAVMLCCVAACTLVFAWGMHDVGVDAGCSRLAAYLTGFMAVPIAGVGIFAYPHPLHNVFGMSELIGYQAPLALALTWRRAPRSNAVVVWSWIFGGLLWAAIALNLSAFDRHGVIWSHLKPIYGLVQRSLFAAWSGWCVVIGLALFRRQLPSAAH